MYKCHSKVKCTEGLHITQWQIENIDFYKTWIYSNIFPFLKEEKKKEKKQPSSQDQSDT